jgi:hypothetical protein
MADVQNEGRKRSEESRTDRQSEIFCAAQVVFGKRRRKPEVHAEVQSPRKTLCKLIVANDDNYALAA